MAARRTDPRETRGAEIGVGACRACKSGVCKRAASGIGARKAEGGDIVTRGASVEKKEVRVRRGYVY